MLLDETGSAAGILARHRRRGAHQHVNLAIRPHSEQIEPQPSAKVAEPRVVFTPLLARRKACGEPNFVARRSAIDTLQNELEVEGQLELADDDDRRKRRTASSSGAMTPIAPASRSGAMR
jgi:hypothetical protein